MAKYSKKEAFYEHPTATRLRLLRAEKGVTQKEVCKKTGIKQRSSLSQYENGEVLPKIDVFENLANFYGVSFYYLLGYSENSLKSNDNIGSALGLSDESISFLQKARENFALKKTINLIFKYGSKEFFNKLSNFCVIPLEENELFLKHAIKKEDILINDNLFEDDFDFKFLKLSEEFKILCSKIKCSEEIGEVYLEGMKFYKNYFRGENKEKFIKLREEINEAKKNFDKKTREFSDFLEGVIKDGNN